MSRRLTLADVAREAGVSKGTASNVFNRPHLVRGKVRERVAAAALKIGYDGPDPRGRMLSAGKVNAIGIVTAAPTAYFFEDPFARALMAAIAEAADAQGIGLSLVSAAEEPAGSWTIQTALVDGFVVFGFADGGRLVDLTKRRQLPFVTIEPGIDDPAIASIGADNFAGARLAAEHLMGLGHRRIAVLSLPFGEDTGSGESSFAEADAADYAATRERARGYMSVLRNPAALLFQTRNDGPSVEAALIQLFTMRYPPTALLCMSDKIALIAIDWLKAHGLILPHDVSITGFDDIAAARASIPPLTTVAQPIAEIGRRAVAAITGKGATGRTMLPPELRVRDSTAPPPAAI